MAHLSIYDLQYGVLPYLIDRFNKREFGSAGILHLANTISLAERLMAFGYEECELNVKTIKIMPFKASNSLNCLLYEFPDPPRQPLAKYALIVFKKDVHEVARYFTLEKSCSFNFDFENKGNISVIPSWVLGEMTTEGHSNYGVVNYEASIDNFIQDILTKFYDNVYNPSQSNSIFAEFTYKPTLYLYLLTFLCALIGGVCTFSNSNSVFLALGGLVCMNVWLLLFQRDLKKTSDTIFVKHKSVALKWGVLYVLGYIIGVFVGISTM